MLLSKKWIGIYGKVVLKIEMEWSEARKKINVFFARSHFLNASKEEGKKSCFRFEINAIINSDMLITFKIKF